jgi:hypothetical protein
VEVQSNPQKKKIDHQEGMSILDIIRQDKNFHQAKSVDWFREKLNKLKFDGSERQEFLHQHKSLQKNIVLPGSMYFFFYDPKHKDTLPFYDRFPLSFIFNVTPKSFFGINFHILPYIIRGKLFDKMWQIAKANRNNPRQQVQKLNWQYLSNVATFPEVRPAVRQYLWSHVRSRFMQIPIEDWKTAIMLSNSDFVKMHQAQVNRWAVSEISATMHAARQKKF